MPALGSDGGEDFRQCRVLPAENVTLADAPALERREMALGDIVDMHHVEPGIDEGRHAAARPPRRIMRPVGVGLTSLGPIGVDGLTITAGRPSAIMASTSRSAATLLRL